MRNTLGRTATAVLVALIALAGPPPATAETPPAGDLREIETAHAAYAAAWLANDRDAVLATLAEDVVLMPGSLAPIEGHSAAAAFWWPDGGPATTITAYETTVDDIRHNGGLAVVRAHSSMTFTWEEDGETSEQTNRSQSLSVLESGADGRWRITLRMWASRP